MSRLDELNKEYRETLNRLLAIDRSPAEDTDTISPCFSQEQEVEMERLEKRLGEIRKERRQIIYGE